MPWRPLLLVLIGLPLLPGPPDPAPSFIAAPVVVDLARRFATAERATPRVPPGVETWSNLPGLALGGATCRFDPEGGTIRPDGQAQIALKPEEARP
jgi:hypothetical protein